MFKWYPLAGALGCALLASSDIRAQSEPIRVEDDAGRVLVLETAPQRIVSLVPVATEILFSLGEGSRLVGRSRFDDYPPEARSIPVVGDAIRPSVETVLLRNPDLVILIGGSDNAEAVREMERLEIPHVVVLFNTLEDLQVNIVRIGRIVGREDLARRLWARIERDLEAVRAAVAGKPIPAVYYDVGYPPAFTIGAGSYLDALLSTAGGRNVFGDLSAPSPRVSLEAIIARDPDVIVYPVGGTGPTHAGGPGERPGWENLRAVKQGTVLEVPSELLHRLGPRVGEAARVLAGALHPETREALAQ
ncbi:MAG: cobalamin-binding protein [Gemmatimonadota bacterium]